MIELDDDILSLRDWILEQLRRHDWNRSDLARRLEISKGTVSKWLAPAWSPSYRHPSYANCLALAQVFRVDRDYVLALAGYMTPPPSRAWTELQRNVVSVVGRLPDDLLVPIYHQLQALVDRQVQADVRRTVLAHQDEIAATATTRGPTDPGA